jgi:hypothetical protein
VYDIRRYAAYKEGSKGDTGRDEAAENGKVFYLKGVKILSSEILRLVFW